MHVQNGHQRDMSVIVVIASLFLCIRPITNGLKTKLRRLQMFGFEIHASARCHNLSLSQREPCFIASSHIHNNSHFAHCLTLQLPITPHKITSHHTTSHRLHHTSSHCITPHHFAQHLITPHCTILCAVRTKISFRANNTKGAR